MSDEMVLMRAGKIMQQGSPSSVFGSPSNRFVAEFLGYENFITATDGSMFTVRPEHLEVAPAGQPIAVGGFALQGSVMDVAYRGVDVLVTVSSTDPSGLPVTLVSDLRADTAPAVSVGDRVTVTAAQPRLVPIAA
jgi:putative spermidine/putrescine transport system ATP-binding protein